MEFILKDGTVIKIRSINQNDLDSWVCFVSGLSKRTKYLRFHSLPKLTKDDAENFCKVDHKNSFAYVALAPEIGGEKIIAIGRYSRLADGNSAEVAIVIADSYQGMGIGRKLMKMLIKEALINSIEFFEAYVLAENTGMLKMLKDGGFHFTSSIECGVYHLKFPIDIVQEDCLNA